MSHTLTQITAYTLICWIVFSGLDLIGSQSNIYAQANLLIDVSSSNTTPATSEVFQYRIRYRCASIVEHCYNSNITFEIHPSLEVVNTPLAVGNVSSINTTVSGTGTLFNVDLESPPSAGAPAGALAAGSTGTLMIGVKFKCEDDAGVTAGSTVNLVQAPIFYAEDVGGSSTTETASMPTAITVPTLAVCQTPSTAPTSPFQKRAGGGGDLAVGPGNTWFFTIGVPAHTGSFQYIDDVPDGVKMWQFSYSSSIAWTVEVDCGSGTFHPIDGFGSGYGWIHSVSAGDPLLDDNGVDTGCVCEQAGPFSDGSSELVADVRRIRVTSPTGSVASDSFYFNYFVDEDFPVGTYIQNCVTTNNPDWDDHCTDVLVSDKPIVWTAKEAAYSRGLGSTDLIPAVASVNSAIYKDPLDAQWQIHVSEFGGSTGALNGFYVDDLLPEGIDYVTDPDKPNYWMVNWTGGGTEQSECVNPTFTHTPNYQGTGRTYLRWDFPSCVFPGNLNAVMGTRRSFTIYFSGRYNLDAPLPNNFLNASYVRTYDGSNMLNVGTLDCRDTLQAVNFYWPPSSGGDLNSAKYVKGALDSDFSRYPLVGDTELSGDGVYEMYIYNHKFEDIKTIDVVDILPFIGDEDLLGGNARGSQWSMELANAITVERFKVGSGLISASGDLGVDGVLYSSSNNPCYLDGSSQIKINGTTGASAGCSAFATGTAATGAKSFAFQWSNSGDPLTFGEYLKITVNVRQLNGEADMTSGEIAWNAFGYTAIQSDDFELFSTEPIKVGLKMIDPTSFASIGNFVWHDANFNGLKDIGEAVFEGIRVSLYNSDGTPVTEDVTVGGVTQQINVITYTDENGFYCFNGLTPSTDYIIRLDNPSDFIASGDLTPFTLTTANAGDDALDSDAALGDLDGNDTDQYPEIEATSPIAGQKTDTYDFGFYKPASVGNFVWEDTDGLGDQSVGEPGVENVTVQLYDADDNLIDTQTTDEHGLYSFENVSPGTYYIQFSSFPGGLTLTSQDVTGNDENDSDANSSGKTSNFQVNSCDVITHIDAGLQPPPANPATISGTIWDDLDCAGGVRGGGDPAIGGITVQLLDNLGFVLQTTTTDGNGDYTFSNVTPSETYNIAVIPPNTSTSFTSAGADMDFNSATGVTTSSITPTDGQNITDIDAGLCGLLSIGNLVWSDANNDGLFNNSEGVFPNVTIYLIDGTDGTTYIDTTSTDANGRYLFYALSAGDYIIEVEIPSTFQSSNDILSTATPNNIDSDDNGTGTSDSGRVRSNAITLAADGGSTANANFGESDHGVIIGGVADPTSDLKAYYTVDFDLDLLPIVQVETA